MALTDLRKWSTTVLRDQSTQDNVQVPTQATVKVYKRGATVSAPSTINTGGVATQVDIYWIGAIELDDDLIVNGNTSQVLRVSAVLGSSGVLLQVKNFGGTTISLVQGDRLTPISSAPPVYSESSGTDSISTTLTANSSGYVEFYTSEPLFDVRVSGTGVTTVLYRDEEGGQARPDFYNVNDYPDVATAIASVPPGARLYFPHQYPHTYAPPTDAGWTLNKQIEIFSDHAPFEATLKAHSQNGVIFKLDTGLKYLYIHDIQFDYAGPGISGTGDFIRYIPTVLNETIGPIRMDRVSMWYPPHNAVRLESPLNNYVVGMTCTDCVFYAAGSDGWYTEQLANATFIHCSFTTNKGAGFRARGMANGSSFLGCDFASNGELLTDTAEDGQLVLTGATVNITGCNIEDFSSAALTPIAKNGIVMTDCRACVIQGNEFDPRTWNSTDNVGSRCIYMKGTGTVPTGGNYIGSNVVASIDIYVEMLTSAGNGNVVMPVSIYTFASGPNNKVRNILPATGKNWFIVTNETQATGQGTNDIVGLALPPQANVTTAEIGSTVLRKGLLVFDDNVDQLAYYDGATWKHVTGVA